MISAGLILFVSAVACLLVYGAGYFTYHSGHYHGYSKGYASGHDTANVLADEEREQIRREWLEKGHARGQTANRVGCPFNLYIMRSDLPPEQEQATIGVPKSGGKPCYQWWGCVDMRIGAEVPLGSAGYEGLLTPEEVLSIYLSLLPDDMRAICGLPPKERSEGQAKA